MAFMPRSISSSNIWLSSFILFWVKYSKQLLDELQLNLVQILSSPSELQ